MPNDYFEHTTQLTRHTLGRAEQVNELFSAVEVGFDRLPAPAVLRENRATYAEDTGLTNAHVVTLDPAPTEYTEGLSIRMKAANNSTGDTTINVNGLGVKAVKRYSGAGLQVNDIIVDQIVDLCYDGVDFKMVGVHGSGTFSAADALVIGNNLSDVGSIVEANNHLLLADNVAGTANAITADLSGPLSTYPDGLFIVFTPTANNSGATTIALGSLGTRTIRTVENEDLIGGELVDGNPAVLVYRDETSVFHLVNPHSPTGSETGTLTGVASGSGTIKWRKDGRNVTLTADSAITGTSNDTGLTITGAVPVGIRPTINRYICCPVTDNGVVAGAGLVEVTAAGVLVFSLLSGASYSQSGFTASGTKGLRAGWSVTYPIAVP